MHILPLGPGLRDPGDPRLVSGERGARRDRGTASRNASNSVNRSSPEWCELGPLVLVFEWKHCTPEMHASALRALERSRCPGREPYRVVMEDHENAILTRVRRPYWGQDL